MESEWKAKVHLPPGALLIEAYTFLKALNDNGFDAYFEAAEDPRRGLVIVIDVANSPAITGQRRGTAKQRHI